MKFNQFLLKTLLTISLVFAGGGANAATTINLGRYVPTADSPVIGGYVPSAANTSYGYVGMTGTCSPVGSFTTYSSGFGLIGSDGLVYSYINCNTGAGNRYKATCPNNTVAMSITSYKRPDTGALFTGVLCVKTDTY